MIRLLLISFVAGQGFVYSDETPCADQAQQCALIVEEQERQIQDVKNLAFKSCFGRNSCVQERVVFDDCFTKSLRTVRAPFLGTEQNERSNEFTEASKSYKSHLEKCFLSNEQPGKPDFTSLLVDEDAIYARAIYGYEFADRLWDLPEMGIEKPGLDPQDSCLVKGPNRRVFGNGIPRIQLDSNPSINKTCRLEPQEVSCYRNFLDHDNQFRGMLKARDRVLRECIQGVRSQRRCRMGQSSRIRSCLCSAREELEVKAEKALLECAKNSPLAQLYSSIVDLDKNDSEDRYRTYAASPQRKNKDNSSPLKELQDDEPSSSSSSAMSITPGVVLNGQCLCACPGSSPPQLFAGKPTPQAQFSTDSAMVFPSIPQASAAPSAHVDSMMAAQLQHQRLVQQYQALAEQHRQLYGTSGYQQPVASGSNQMGTMRSIESGIGDGFERFFNGMPPIRRRDVSRRIPKL
ncbi:unnamed protein product [Bursaphelenchus xylophilus]|uniref:(pine wood nematode) hypothetical protein n=1 Tax=Bursaphelenchus xylophilus TaxID=6326 RepID=A0A1I7SLF4_BURXY|nr:unnamed protein product [Bursaphelenchus xylophilus]CAG9129553.1 unnamed protein product [Bursaphelenchus xylophilus]